MLRCDTHISIEGKDVPIELVDLISSNTFDWPNQCEAEGKQSIEILSIKRIQKNKKYKVRYINSFKKDAQSVTFSGIANYFLFVEQNETTELKLLRWEFIEGEI